MSSEFPRARVFIYSTPENLGTDALEEFGRVIPLADANGVPALFDTDGQQHYLMQELRRWRYNPSRDYIAVVGAVVPNTLLLHLLGSYYESCKVLFFNAKTRTYIERNLRT